MIHGTDLIFKSSIVGEANKWKREILSPYFLNEWQKTMTGTLYSYQAFGGILYGMMSSEDGEQAWFVKSEDFVAATDDKLLYINPNPFFALPFKQRIFVKCHEIFHAMFNHCGIMHKYRKLGKITYSDGTVLPYVEEVMQAAGDCVVNVNLVNCRVGEMPPNAYYQPFLVPITMSLLDAYRVLYKASNGGQGLNKKPMSQNGGDVTNSSDLGQQQAFDKHLTPGQGRGKTVNEAISERNQIEWDAAVTAAVHTMKAMGVGSAALERMFNKVTEPDYDWFNALRHVFNRNVGYGRQTWDCLDPEFLIRGIGAPGKLNYGAGFVGIAVDSSGSIDQSMMDEFMSHVGVIVDEVRPKEILIAQCDDRIHEYEYIHDSTQLKRKVKGGGGTDFRPVFERIEQENLNLDVLVYFTDTYGRFPSEAPPFSVIWASTVEDAKVPFGEIVYIPLQKKSRWRFDNDE